MPSTYGLLFKYNAQIELSLWRRTLFETILVFIMLLLILVNPISYTKKLLYSRYYFEGDHSMESHKLDDINIIT